METLFQVLKLLGSLGLFLYGMTLMSEGLQKVAGDKMRAILAAMTSNSLKRILTGLFITSIIQSSSATTVMVVSFVNAGLLSLTQSIGVIMGANIGTTVTAWIVTLLGFKMDISAISIPLVGLGFALMMFKSKRRKSLGEFIMGFALLFLGLAFLKDSVPDLQSTPEVFEFLKEWTSFGFWSVLLFVGIGTLLTIVLQSSSATMALTLVMSSYGWLPFEAAAAMVLGENIGTTITANLAAIVANVSARRAALAHTLFNVTGVIWVLALYKPVLSAVSYIVVSLFGEDPFLSSGATLYGISMLHSLFNITNTMLLVWFTPLIVKTVTYIIKPPKGEETFRLKFIQSGPLSTSELSLTQAKHEIVNFATLGKRQFTYAREAIIECDKENDKGAFDRLIAKLEHYEEVIDKVEIEIAKYLNKISEGELSEESGRRLQSMYRIISEIESIGDSGLNIAQILKRKKTQKVFFNEHIQQNIFTMLDLLDDAFRIMIDNLEQGYTKIHNIDSAEELEVEINNKRTSLKDCHPGNLENKTYGYLEGIHYMDIIEECEKAGDYIINVSEAVMQIKL